MRLRLIKPTKIYSLFLVAFCSVLLSVGIQYYSAMTFIILLTMCLFWVQLWANNLRAFVYLLLGLGMPLFPDVGINLGGQY